MNPLVLTRIKQMGGLIGEIRSRLEERKDLLEQAQEKREEMQQKEWRHRKQISTLGRIADDFEGVEEQNRALVEEREVLKEHLGRILGHTKALSNTLGP